MPRRGRRIAIEGLDQPTRSTPRNLVLLWPATVLIQPKASSMRFRMRWLTV